MKCIVAVDGSTESRAALDEAMKYADGLGADLQIVHAATRQIEEEGGERVLEAPSEAEDRGQHVLERVESWVDHEGEVETTLLLGEPGKVVAKYANSEGVDAIFVGHRGLSEEHEKLVGSVAKKLIDRADMPVMVVGGG